MIRTERLTQRVALEAQYRGLDFGSLKCDYGASLALLYHENTKLAEADGQLLGQRVQGFSSPYILERSCRPFKTYPGNTFVALPRLGEVFGQTPGPFEERDWPTLLRRRKSVRKYGRGVLAIEQLAAMLHAAYGVVREVPIQALPNTKLLHRTVPSSGGLYPLEWYVLLFESELEPGIYHYRPDRSGLEHIRSGCLRDALDEVVYARPYIGLRGASAVFLVSAVFERLMLKYGDRGYRFALLEAGAAGQNLSQACDALGLGCCWLGGFRDDAVHDLVGLDGLTESLVNIIVVGKLPKN